MFRWVYLLTAFVALAAWAGAQGPVPPAPLSPEDKLRLLRANTTLIENLVNDGVAMSTDPVDRAERSRSAARALVNAVQKAAETEDAERVAELTGLFRVMVSEGLVPAMNDVRQQNPNPESPGGKRLRKVRDDSADDLKDLKRAASTGKLSAHPRVNEALKQLDELADALK